MVAEGEFTVTLKKKEVVAAVLPLQEHWLPLSNLDLLLPPLNVGVFFCYKNLFNSSEVDNHIDLVSVLKESLAQTLVAYYAFAGEVVTNSVGEPELLCNNCGVEFSEAYADVELLELNFYNPDETVEGKFIPSRKRGVIAFQATELRCGGLVVGCSFDHRIADAYSTNLFLVSWTEMAQRKSMSSIPSFRRSLLNPRRPLCVDESIDNLYVPISSMPSPNNNTTTDDHLISRIYYIKYDQLCNLQSLASVNGSKTTKFRAFSAFLWKLVARSAKGYGDDIDIDNKISKMGIVVDGRSRLSEGEENTMGNYFGNVLSIPYGEIQIDDLIQKPLYWVANQVQEILDKTATKEHFLGLVDWVEANRPTTAVAKIYCNGGEDGDGPAFVVSSGQRFPVTEMDFGWGKPHFGSYHFPWGGNTGYVMPMPCPAGNGDWVVYMHLSKRHLELIESEAKHVFSPLTSDYLSNCLN
ncbi:hypothetical protein ACFE04_001967 [Oxalis oulophora]